MRDTETPWPWAAAGVHCWVESAPRWPPCSCGWPSGFPSSAWRVACKGRAVGADIFSHTGELSSLQIIFWRLLPHGYQLSRLGQHSGIWRSHRVTSTFTHLYLCLKSGFSAAAGLRNFPLKYTTQSGSQLLSQETKLQRSTHITTSDNWDILLEMWSKWKGFDDTHSRTETKMEKAMWLNGISKLFGRYAYQNEFI